MKRLIVCALLMILLAEAAGANTIQLGLGFDRSHDGHGFDLHKAGDTYVLFFYTYDAAGEPEWYLGLAENCKGELSGELTRVVYRPDEDPPQQVDASFSGSFTLDFNDAANSPACSDGVDRDDAIQLSVFHFDINGDAATWCTEWLSFGAANADSPYYGGVWYAGEDDPGYGYSMTHMDATVVAVVYYYDADGNPRWALGTARPMMHWPST